VNAEGVPKRADHRIRFHDLRHAAAAIWIDLGRGPKQLQASVADTSRAIERDEHLFDGHNGCPWNAAPPENALPA
jgi:hypothetical protein